MENLKDQQIQQQSETIQGLSKQVETLSRELEKCLEPVSEDKEHHAIEVHEMIKKHGSQQAWIAKIDELFASYDPAMLKLIKSFGQTMQVKEYIDLLNDSYAALVSSPGWKRWSREMREESAFTHKVMMDFLINLRVILERRDIERTVRGI